MTTLSPFSDYIARLRASIAQPAHPQWAGGAGDSRFNSFALQLFALQFAHNAGYRRFCESRHVGPSTVGRYADIPAVPTTAFKELEMTSLSPEQRARVFHSSGTSEQRPSRHFHDTESLSLYEASLLPWFQKYLLNDWLAPDKIAGTHFIFLTPPPELAPNSSLVHMFATLREHYPTVTSQFFGRIDQDGAWSVDAARATALLTTLGSASRPVVLLGTAFNFVHLLDWLNEQGLKLTLHPDSRVLETGGYKGRSRNIPKSELHSMISEQFGIRFANIVTEYGMSELSSQAYDVVAGEKHSASRVFHFPPWARVQIVSPETGREVADGETGLIRIFDLANVRSVLAIQTEDLGIRRGVGFELLGRATLAEARGCSLMSQ